MVDHQPESARGLTLKDLTSSELSERLDVGPINIVDTNNLWAVGHIRKPQGFMEFASLILHSSSGGLSWDVQLYDPDRYLRDVYFVNRRVGWLCGNDGLVLRSTDGGRSWNPQSTRSEFDLSRIRFIDADVGWVMSSDGEVLRTTDGGLHWSAHGLQMDGFGLHILRFADSLNVWIAGENSQLYQSIDGGQTWRSRGREFVGLIDKTGKHHAFFTDIEFVTPSIGFVAAYVVPKMEFVDNHNDISNKGVIFKTVDGGSSWSVLLEKDQQLLTGADFVTETEIRVFLYRDEVLHTTDGGKTWNRVGGMPKTSNVQFSDTNHGWARIRQGPNSDRPDSRIYFTIDGGRTWKPAKLPLLTERMLSSRRRYRSG